MVPIKTAMRSQDRPQINTFGTRMIESGISEQATEQLKNYFKLTSKTEIRVTSAEELVAQMKSKCACLPPCWEPSVPYPLL